MARREAGVCVYKYIYREAGPSTGGGKSRRIAGGLLPAEEGGKGEGARWKKRRGGRSGRRNVNPVAVVARHEQGGEGTMLKFPIF